MSNNTEGWEPSYTYFSPILQAEKCDADGDYIRQWIPELRNVKGKAIFAPWQRLSDAEYQKQCPDYPKPDVDLGKSKEVAIQRYKEGVQRARDEGV